MPGPAHLLTDDAPALRFDLFHMDGVETDWAQRPAMGRRSAVDARAAWIGLGLLEKLSADDGIGRASTDHRAETLPFDEIETIPQGRRVARKCNR